MSGDWREAIPSPHGFYWFNAKPLGYLAEPQSQTEDSAWLTGQNRSDRLVKLVRPVWGRRAPGGFEAEDTRHDRKSCLGVMRACDGCAFV
jgi:hypothetical protein